MGKVDIAIELQPNLFFLRCCVTGLSLEITIRLGFLFAILVFPAGDFRTTPKNKKGSNGTGLSMQMAVSSFQLNNFLKSSSDTELQMLFLSDPGIPGVQSMGPGLSNRLREVLQT